MRRLVISAPVVALTAALLSAAPAGAYVAHTVEPGETLWSIAAANSFTTRSLAAANGLPETAQVVTGQTIQIPSEYEAASGLGGTQQATPASSGTGGGYTVRPGDTLSAIAARAGTSVGTLAAQNGLSSAVPLLAGTTLTLPSGSAAPATTAPASAPTSSGGGAEPVPTDEHVSPQQVGQIAAAHGVSPSLASAIAKQESGYYNGSISSANARGVMQILPGTWDFIERGIAGRQIAPGSAQENVHAGVMYLGRLLRETGGDESTAAASYYQGLASVRNRGLFDDTQQYVNNVMALRGTLGP